MMAGLISAKKASATTGAPLCNPTGGYAKGTYAFYKSGLLKPTMVFDAKAACATPDGAPRLFDLVTPAAPPGPVSAGPPVQSHAFTHVDVL